jgi:hypothetical protein
MAQSLLDRLRTVHALVEDAQLSDALHVRVTLIRSLLKPILEQLERTPADQRPADPPPDIDARRAQR